MAALETIRNRAGLLVGVIGLALFAFVIGDFLNSGSSFFRSQQDKVVVVNGKKVSFDDFNNRINELTEVYKIQLGQQTLPEEYNVQIRQAAYEGIVREEIMNEEFEKLGITVSPEELFDLIQGKNISPMVQQIPFFRNPQTGAFDKAMLLNFLRTINATDLSQYGPEGAEQVKQLKNYWMFWEKSIKQQRLEEKYNALIAKGVIANPIEAQSMYNGGKVNADFAFAMQPYASIPDSTIKVSDKDYQKVYDKYKEQFKQEETRSVKYLALPIRPSKDDYAEVEQKMDEIQGEFTTSSDVKDLVMDYSDSPYIDAYVSVSSLSPSLQAFVNESNVGDVKSPSYEGDVYSMAKILGKTTAADSANVRMIVLPNDAQGEKLADSLSTELSKGAKFNELAAQFSHHQSAQNGGELGWVNEIAASQAGSEFVNAAFNAPLNKVTTIKTPYGIQLVQVTERTAPVAKAKLAVIDMEVTPSQRTSSNLYNELSSYIASNKNIADFEKNAIEKGYNVLSNPALSGNDYSLGTLQNARQATAWAFRSAKKGDISQIFEIDNNFVVVALDGITEKGYTPLAQVKALLRNEVINDKKAEMIISDLKSKNLTSLDAYAQAMQTSVDTAMMVNFNTQRITGIGNEPVLCALAPMSQLNQLSAPVKGMNGVFVINVFNKVDSEKPYDQKAEISTIENSLAYRIIYQTYNVLRMNADIDDNRVSFF